MKQVIKDNYKLLILLISLVIFIILFISIFEEQILLIDINFYNILKKHIINDNLTPYIKLITFFGSAICLISITILLLIFIKDKKISFSITLNLILATLFNQALKHVIQRPRPSKYNIINESGYSFPSGHSMISMAFYGFLIYLIHKNIKNKYLKTLLITILSLLIIAIGLSRIYLGVHYLSDVIGGFIIAIIYLVIYIKITTNKMNK